MRIRSSPSLMLLLIACAVGTVACTRDEGQARPDTPEPVVRSTVAPDPVGADTAESTTTTAGSPDGPPVYVALVWEHHQPWYPADEDGVVSQPWVRLRAASDYYAETAALAEFDDVAVSFNVTPTFVRQLEGVIAGVRDRYWLMTGIDAAELTDDDKQFLMRHFFDVPDSAIEAHPRLAELRQTRDDAGGVDAPVDAFEEQDYRDLQVLFNLAWTERAALDAEPLRSVVAKGADFLEADKSAVLGTHVRLAGELLEMYQELWASGRIEVSTAPLANPALPLLADTGVGSSTESGAVYPDRRFQHITDVDSQISTGLDAIATSLGSSPLGMRPADGVLSSSVAPLFDRHDVRWVVASEDVLAASQQAPGAGIESAHRYAGWRLAGGSESLVLFFGDAALADEASAERRSELGADAARDLVNRLHSTARNIADDYDPNHPPIIPVVLDDHAAWAPGAGSERAFVAELYRALSASPVLRTTTPSAFLEEFDPVETLARLESPDVSQWIGDREEARAWDYLARVRDDLDVAAGRVGPDDEGFQAAYESMLYAQGADWFSWFGPDRTSSDDAYFDWAFRRLLSEVYTALESDVPAFLDVPVIPSTPVRPEVVPGEMFTPTVDFTAGAAEWAEAGYYTSDSELIERVHYGYDRSNLYLRVDYSQEVLGNDDVGFEVYLGTDAAQEGRGTTLRGTVVGFDATALVEWRGSEPLTACLATELPPVGDNSQIVDCKAIEAGFDGDSIELALPLRSIGDLDAGDRISMRVVSNDVFRDTELFPAQGPAVAQLPPGELPAPEISIADPRGDDHGPGGYTYPTGAVYESGSFDITAVEVAQIGDESVLVAIDMAAPMVNPWDAPAQFSLQAFDIYIDSRSGGAGELLAGRRAALTDGAWDVAVAVNGWETTTYLADESGAVGIADPSSGGVPESAAPAERVGVTVFGDAGRVEVRIPAQILGEVTASDIAVAVIVVAHDPEGGVDGTGVRAISAEASEDALGGAPDDGNHTRIVDVAWPEPGEQETWLATHEAVPAGTRSNLGALPLVPMLRPES